MLRAWRPSASVGAVVVLVAAAGAVTLERIAGRFAYHPGVALAGLALVGAGLVLNHRARRVLGPHWAALVQVRAGHTLVQHGPYAHVRHPIYAAILWFLAAAVLTHRSPANFALGALGAAMLAVRIAAEERLLAERYPEYAAYAARTKRVVPFVLCRAVTTR